jgi:hypothetical protein
LFWGKGDINMTQEIMEQLMKIYNTLLLVSTKGEDTVIMGQCLAAMRQVLTDLTQNAESPSANSQE